MAKKLPSVLAFEKKIVPSNGMMFATKWNSRNENMKNIPLRIISKSVKGTISNRLKASDTKDPAKLDKMIENANLQIVDSCTLPVDFDTLHMFFTLKILGNIKTPSACNDVDFKKKYENLVKGFIETESFDELGLRYAINIANGRFLWRNRVGSSNIEIHVRNEEDDSIEFVFNSLDYSLRSFDNYDEKVKDLANLISKTLSSESGFLNLEINAFVKMGNAQEVYPSEELVLDKSNSNSTGKKSKILFSVDDIAGMHSQKIGNAIRTIDSWYEEYTDTGSPISVETYGSVTTLGKAYRNPKHKNDFYSIFDKATENERFNNSDEANYIMAMLVRGGVFGDGSK